MAFKYLAENFIWSQNYQNYACAKFTKLCSSTANWAGTFDYSNITDHALLRANGHTHVRKRISRYMPGSRYKQSGRYLYVLHSLHSRVPAHSLAKFPG